MAKAKADSPAAALARLRAESLTQERRQEIASIAGQASADKLTEEERRARAVNAVNARWAKARAAKKKKR